MRIAIVGNGGGGKSTLAAKIGAKCGIEVASVDKVQFGPNWQRTPLDVVSKWHRKVLRRPDWIIDGWGDWPLIEARISAADTVVFVDFPLETHLALARRREDENRMGQNPYAPACCRYQDVEELMTETLIRVDRDYLPRLRAVIARMRPEQRLIRVSDPAELNAAANSIISENPRKGASDPLDE